MATGWPRGQGRSGRVMESKLWSGRCQGDKSLVRESFLLLILHFASARNKEEADAAPLILIELNELKNNFV